VPSGLFEPVWCKNKMWIADIATRIKGSRKWIEKNRFRVAFPTENPPHSQYTIVGPT